MTDSRLFKGAMLLCAVFAFFFATRTASASALTYADTINPFVVASDAGTVYVTDITITNPNTYSVQISDLAGSNAGSSTVPNPIVTTHNNGPLSTPAGNPNDIVTSAAFYDDMSGYGTNCYVNEVLAAGGTCTVELSLTVTGVAPATKGSAGEKDNYGLNLIQVYVNSFELGHPNTTPAVTAKFVTEVDYAPEPSSLLLLGSGMLGLAGVLRRKFSRA